VAKTQRAKASAEPDRSIDVGSTLFSYREAAAYLGVTERRMRRAVALREVPYIKVGKLVRFRQEALDEFIEANTVAAAR
jgi:excisionase family DNA binding protein